MAVPQVCLFDVSHHEAFTPSAGLKKLVRRLRASE